MRWRFFNGMVIGTLVGVLAAKYYNPKTRPAPKRYLMGQTRRIGQHTGRMVSNVAREVQELIRR